MADRHEPQSSLGVRAGVVKRQKGGWLLHKIADTQGAIAKRVASLLLRAAK